MYPRMDSRLLDLARTLSVTRKRGLPSCPSPPRPFLSERAYWDSPHEAAQFEFAKTTLGHLGYLQLTGAEVGQVGLHVRGAVFPECIQQLHSIDLIESNLEGARLKLALEVGEDITSKAELFVRLKCFAVPPQSLDHF